MGSLERLLGVDLAGLLWVIVAILAVLAIASVPLSAAFRRHNQKIARAGFMRAPDIYGGKRKRKVREAMDRAKKDNAAAYAKTLNTWSTTDLHVSTTSNLYPPEVVLPTLDEFRKQRNAAAAEAFGSSVANGDISDLIESNSVVGSELKADGTSYPKGPLAGAASSDQGNTGETSSPPVYAGPPLAEFIPAPLWNVPPSIEVAGMGGPVGSSPVIGSNGSGGPPNRTLSNGTGRNGSKNETGKNGTHTNGSGRNGTGHNGSGKNGTGSHTNGSNGSHTNGYGADESGLGNRDLGNRDLGNRDLGNRDLGNRDLGNRDLGNRDLGNRDLGNTGFGDDWPEGFSEN